MSLAILRRASALTVISFAWAGALNVLPQLYMMKHHPDHKSALLSAVLFAGTVASILGVSLSRARLGERPSRSVALACVALFLAVALEVRPLALYLAAYVIFRFASNWLFNQLDHTLLSAAGAAGAKAHATATTGFTILGQLTGPVALVALAGHPWTALALLLVLGGWAMFAVRDLESVPARPPAQEELHTRDALGSRRALSYLLYGLLMLTGVAGFFSQLIFLLRDYVAIESAGRHAGLLMMGTGAVSIVTVLISTRLSGGLSRGDFLLPALLGALAIVVFATKPGVPGLLLVAALGGISGGRLLLSTRLCAATWEGAPGRGAMLSLYNNLSNGAALVAYALTGLVSLLLEETSPRHHLALLGLLFTLFTAAAALCAASPFVARSPESP